MAQRHVIDKALDIAEELRTSIVFQPAGNSLFLETDRDGSAWQLDTASTRDVVARIEQYKQAGRAAGNLNRSKPANSVVALSGVCGSIRCFPDHAGSALHAVGGM